MINFDFISPTKIYFGKDRELEIGSILSKRDYHKVLIVYGKSSIKKIGLYDKVIKSLDDNNIKHVELSGVRPNPSNDLVIEGVKLARENKIDALLAIGGGSVIDTAKAISVGYFYDGDPFDFNLHKVKPSKALPLGVILTLSASGSELSNSCVISNDKLGVKQGFNNDLVRPEFAILNPELTYSVDKYQTGCGVVDIISHSLERYFAPSDDINFSDDIALAIIKNTIESGKKCIANPKDYDSRATMMLCGSYSHNGISGLGKKVEMVIHRIEHALSAYKNDIAHGAGLSVLIPAWMQYVYDSDVDKFYKFSLKVFNNNFDDKYEGAKIGILNLRDTFKSIGMPITLGELGLSEKDIPAIVGKIFEGSTHLIGNSTVKPLNRDDVNNLLLSVI